VTYSGGLVKFLIWLHIETRKRQKLVSDYDDRSIGSISGIYDTKHPQLINVK
jgi:hypothetical protein